MCVCLGGRNVFIFDFRLRATISRYHDRDHSLYGIKELFSELECNFEILLGYFNYYLVPSLDVFPFFIQRSLGA